MAGIPDMLTDIRTTGQGVPMGGPPPGQPPMGPPPGQPPMGGPPPGQPPMGPPPGMGGGLASMGRGQPPMGPPPGMGGGQPPMGMEEPPREEPMSIEKDAAMLAEATMGRTGGDPEAAAAILQTATQMIMSVGPQGDPMMMNNGGPIYARSGKHLSQPSRGERLQNWSRENLPFYELIGEEKVPEWYTNMSENYDTDTLKQMIMDGLKDVGTSSVRAKSLNLEDYRKFMRDNEAEIRTLSDRDNSGSGSSLPNPTAGLGFEETLDLRTLSARDLAAYEAAMANSQSSGTLSDRDMNYQDALDMLVKQRKN